MYDTILIATDGSDETKSAVAHGVSLAETYGATVHALYVVDIRALGYDDEDDGFLDDDTVLDALTDRGHRVTDEIERRARSLGVDAKTAVVRGTPAREIRGYADDHDVDLIAMGTRGRGGISRYLLGSVAESVIGRATQPVLTARPSVSQETAYDRILLPTDGSESVDRIADHAFDVAAHYDATVHALSIIDNSLIRSPELLAALEAESEAALEEIERQARDSGVDLVTGVWRGRPNECITSYADDRAIDLITMAAHEKRGLSRYLSLTVTERVVRRANCPVLSLSGRRDVRSSGE